ncbi:MAG TPA: hypothetical protein VMN03_05480, partial [Burkholderiales bacterium]|nr:hypothetical protein [Burkholderiales bacterium]
CRCLARRYSHESFGATLTRQTPSIGGLPHTGGQIGNVAAAGARNRFNDAAAGRANSNPAPFQTPGGPDLWDLYTSQYMILGCYINN